MLRDPECRLVLLLALDRLQATMERLDVWQRDACDADVMRLCRKHRKPSDLARRLWDRAPTVDTGRPPPNHLWQAYAEASEDLAFLRRLGNFSRGRLIPLLLRRRRAHVVSDVEPAVRCRLSQRLAINWRHAFRILWPRSYRQEVEASANVPGSRPMEVCQAVLTVCV